MGDYDIIMKALDIIEKLAVKKLKQYEEEEKDVYDISDMD